MRVRQTPSCLKFLHNGTFHVVDLEAVTSLLDGIDDRFVGDWLRCLHTHLFDSSIRVQLFKVNYARLGANPVRVDRGAMLHSPFLVIIAGKRHTPILHREKQLLCRILVEDSQRVEHRTLHRLRFFFRLRVEGSMRSSHILGGGEGVRLRRRTVKLDL